MLLEFELCIRYCKVDHCEYNVYVNFSKIAISPIIRGGNKCENYLEFNLVVRIYFLFLSVRHIKI